MSHWAELDDNNIVLRVTVGDNNDPAGDEGYQWLIDNLGGRWVKTSYNSKEGKYWVWKEEQKFTEDGQEYTCTQFLESDKPHFRYNFAGIGFYYDETRDAFIPPKPEEGNWILNEETCVWEEVTE